MPVFYGVKVSPLDFESSDPGARGPGFKSRLSPDIFDIDISQTFNHMPPWLIRRATGPAVYWNVGQWKIKELRPCRDGFTLSILNVNRSITGTLV